MIEHEGFWWPAEDRDAHGIIAKEVHTAVPALLTLVPGRVRIVQAGGNVGVYPKALAEHFANVLTLEPAWDNMECLLKNLEGVENIDARFAGLGPNMGTCRVQEVHPGNCGAHRIVPDGCPYGTVAMLTLDSFKLDACDAVWLDIEGFELAALQGAAQTIEKFHPVIATEEKGLGAAYGIGGQDIAEWLSQFGYKPVDRIGRDTVYVV